MERKRETLQWPLKPKELKKVVRLFSLLAAEVATRAINTMYICTLNIRLCIT